MKIFIKSFILIILILILSVFANAADDSYKPYLHQASVPEHPKVKMHGTYTTNLFPGAATYTYSIEVPKGTNNLQPSLNVYYNSQSVKQRPGIVGAGWSITESYIYRDTNSSLTNTADDKFKLVLMGNGYDLVYDNIDGFYHTKLENYLRIENLSGVNYWIVTDKDGTQYRFGFNNDSEITSNTGKGYSLFWYLDLITDSHGNNIYYTYQQNKFNGDKGAIYSLAITYNNDKERKIDFSYSARNDYRLVYEQGNEVNYNGILSEINITSDNIIRRYVFAYAPLNNWNSLSTLGNITNYGNNGSYFLHRVSLDYYPAEPGYAKVTDQWKPPTYFSDDESKTDNGVRLIDLNKDGFVDVAQAKEVSPGKNIWINNKSSGWISSNLFVLPVYIVDGNGVDYGVRFEDFNKDGFVDILQGTQVGGNTLKAWRNNGTGFVEFSAMAPPIYFSDGNGLDEGVQFGDINGDGYNDILQSIRRDVTITKKVYINNKSNGWVDVTSNDWSIPVTFIDQGTVDLAVRVVDVNGDGLADILEAGDGGSPRQNAWLNNGTNWSKSTTWQPTTYFTTGGNTDRGDRFADIDGDGLIDIIEDFQNGTGTTRNALLNIGHGWFSSSSWQSPEPFTLNGHNIGRRVADVNGDGYPDIVIGFSNSTGQFLYTWTKNYTIPYLLKTITNEYGGVTNITYNSSTKFNNTGNDLFSDIGFNVFVVQNVEQNNSMKGLFKLISYTNYTYTGGSYDYLDSEFRGFAIVNETRPDNSLVMHYFHQDVALKGKEYRTEVYNSSLAPYSTEAKQYRSITNQSYYKIFLDSALTYSYEGNLSNPKVTGISYTYNDYGDVTRKLQMGNANASGDEKWEDYVYYYNSTNWIMGKVRRYELEDNNTVSKATWFSYDGNVNDGPQSKGDLTRVENWLSSGSNPMSTYEYNAHGNLIKEVDALGRVTTHQYCGRDATCTYKDRTVNALGHAMDYQYELGTGNLLWEEKNGIKKNYYYDIYGRLLKEIQPFDDTSMPTISYNYSFDGVAPEVVKVSKKAAANKTIDSYYYYDGFSNLIQVRSSAENNQQTVKDIIYDGMFRVSAESHPYFMNFNLTLNTGNTKYTNYTYDALSRVTLVKNADGTNKSIVFGKFNVTAFDENNHKKEYKLDVYDRIINVYEFNNDPVINSNVEELYNTSYVYDLQDNLVKITDTLGNNLIFGFDTLGRKTSLDDPDLGKWAYSYDAAGNLLRQTDARGNFVNLTYDKLNRVSIKNANISTNFSYDGQYQGTLSNITFSDPYIGSITYRFTYDDRYRVVNEEVNIEGIWSPTGKTYDSMDRLLEERVPNGTSIDYMYNAQGLIDKIPGFVTATSYNAFGNPLNRTFSSGNVMNFTYDSNNARLNSISSGSLQNLAYGYDNAGNIIQINDDVNKRKQNITYDFLDRVVNVSINSSHYRYVYDETGSIVKIITDYNLSTRFMHLSTHKHAPSSVINGSAGIMIYKLKLLNPTSKDRKIEFYLVNERNETLTNVNYTIELGDGTSNSSTGINLTIGQALLVSLNHTYSNAGNYNVSVRASHANNTDNLDDKTNQFGIKADALSLLHQNVTNTTFEFKVRNDMVETANNINWSCDNGLSSSNRFNLTGNQTIFIIIASNYSTAGGKILTCYANSSNGNDTKILNFNIRDVEVAEYNSTIVSGNKRKINILFRNYFSTQTVSWTIASDGQSYSGSTSVGANNYSLISQQINYTAQGLKTINSNISTTSTVDNRTESFMIKGLEIEQYFRTNKTSTDKIMGYTVKNYWDNMTVNWTFSSPAINGNARTNLSYNETIFVFIEENYTTSGTKDTNFTVFNGTGTFATSYFDRFIVNVLEILSTSMLYGSPDLTISEIIARSNIAPFNVSWRYNTGRDNITSSIPITLNNTAFIIIAHNYTASGTYATEATVNSSSYNATLAGVVIA